MMNDLDGMSVLAVRRPFLAFRLRGIVPVLLLLWAGCTKVDPRIERELAQHGLAFEARDYVKCAKRGRQDLLQLYLDGGMPVDAVKSGREPSSQKTALLFAVERGDPQLVRFLIGRGADVNHTQGSVLGQGTFNILARAAAKGRLEITRILLDEGAEINETISATNDTSLMLAAGEGHADVVKLLISRGADLEVRHQRTRQSQQETEDWEKTALFFATDRGHLDAARVLLDAGAEVDTRKRDGRTPLMEAARKGQTEMADLLIRHGAQLELKEEQWGWTALLFAANAGSTGAAKLLLAHGADPKVVDQDGKTALSLASARGFPQIVELLKRSGATK